ncbi:MAG TPA: exodeoxyribonuclease VII large subunit, partial [Spirochaetota bacterium]|nr:exodeoxyribonuclease VII large subunit [Spirochaetota bacterium]
MNNTPLSITELSSVIKQTIEGNSLLSNVAVIGEVSNVTNHSSGHIYFTLKDSGAVISAAFFKYANRSCKVRLKEGLKVIALGSVTVYEKRGSYQLIVKSLIEDGIGELQRQIQELKERLLKEGLFDDERKKSLPFLPRRIGIVTSPTGAAFRDILKVLLRRFPNVEVVLAPAKVQGSDASVSIVRA